MEDPAISDARFLTAQRTVGPEIIPPIRAPLIFVRIFRRYVTRADGTHRPITVMWFGRYLHVDDHPARATAAARGRVVALRLATTLRLSVRRTTGHRCACPACGNA